VVLVAVVSGIVRIARSSGVPRHDDRGGDQLSRGLASATWHAMLADDRQAAYDTMQVVARQPGISRIRIFNKEGRIMFSTAPEAGQLVDKNAEACVLCHASAEPLVRVDRPSRARVFTGPRGGGTLAMITPDLQRALVQQRRLPRPPRARQNVLGVLDVALDLGRSTGRSRRIAVRRP
jgi:two-component system, NtrC family, sensor kinase